MQPTASVAAEPSSRSPARAGADRLGRQAVTFADLIIAHERAIVTILLFLGLILRARRFIAGRALWYDEAAVAANVISRGWYELTQPLDYAQAAPLGFLYLLKALGSVLGYSEYVLRSPAFVAGLLVLPASYLLFRTLAGIVPAVLALFILVVEKRMIGFSGDVKPYLVDVLAAVLVLLSAQRMHTEGCSRGGALRFAALGAVAVWFSLSAIFVIAGVALAWAACSAWRRDTAGLARVGLASLACGVSFGAHYLVALRGVGSAGLLRDCWEYAFWHLPPASWGDVFWPFASLRHLFQGVVKTGVAELGVVLFLVGCIMLWRRSRWSLVLLLSPIVPAVVASVLHKYPFADRLLLYMAPALALLLAVPLAWLLSRADLRAVVLGVVLLLGTMAENIGGAVANMWRLRWSEQANVVLRQVARQREPGDFYWTNAYSLPALQYYGRRWGFLPDVTAPESLVCPVEELSQRLASRTNSSRVWFFSVHGQDATGNASRAATLKYADTIGTCIQPIGDLGAYANLYLVRPAPRD